MWLGLQVNSRGFVVFVMVLDKVSLVLGVKSFKGDNRGEIGRWKSSMKKVRRGEEMLERMGTSVAMRIV